MNTLFFILLLLLHWAADYTQLSRPYMLKAKSIGHPLLPILHHSLIHGILQSILTFIFYGINFAVIAFVLQTSSHFLIDTIKGKLNVWIPSLKNQANVYHWWVFGLDQTLHIIVLLIISKIVLI